jgi:Na+-transporting methylmalonyl-CoA/oxaloacetate decarboxylase gamma subunit
MDFVRRFGLVICAAALVALSVGFLAYLYLGEEGVAERTLLDMDFAFGADGDSTAELIWTIIAGAAGVFAFLSLLTALVPDFGRREGHVEYADRDDDSATTAAAIDTDAVQGRMKATAEEVDGVDRAEARVFTSDDNDRVDRAKLDLYLEEGRDPGRISDEVAERVRNMFREEYDSEPVGGFEVDVHQPRKFFQGTSEPA